MYVHSILFVYLCNNENQNGQNMEMKERKVLTDEELEQVSGGQSNYGPVCSNQPKDVCLSVGCYWSDKSNRCYDDEGAANLYESGKSARRRPIFDMNTA